MEAAAADTPVAVLAALTRSSTVQFSCTRSGLVEPSRALTKIWNESCSDEPICFIKDLPPVSIEKQFRRET
jgi:hypothetical protein